MYLDSNRVVFALLLSDKNSKEKPGRLSTHRERAFAPPACITTFVSSPSYRAQTLFCLIRVYGDDDNCYLYIPSFGAEFFVDAYSNS